MGFRPREWERQQPADDLHSLHIRDSGRSDLRHGCSSARHAHLAHPKIRNVDELAGQRANLSDMEPGLAWSALVDALGVYFVCVFCRSGGLGDGVAIARGMNRRGGHPPVIVSAAGLNLHFPIFKFEAADPAELPRVMAVVSALQNHLGAHVQDRASSRRLFQKNLPATR